MTNYYLFNFVIIMTPWALYFKIVIAKMYNSHLNPVFYSRVVNYLFTIKAIVAMVIRNIEVSC